MSYIELKHVQAVAEELLQQASILNTINEEMRQIELSLRTTSYLGDAKHLLIRCCWKTENCADAMRQMGGCLEEVTQMYRAAEARITDMYNLEIVQYPETQFGTSRITGLDAYKDMIVFRTMEDQDGRLY